jgi:uncharacterized membrane protein
MQTRQKTDEQQRYSVSRLVAFSDGVFGFAITLLIVNVIGAFPPLPSSATDPRLLAALLGLGSTFFSYALSFYVVGAYWIAHHRIFSSIIRSTSMLLWLNLTLLFFVVFLPFPTSLLGKYNSVVIAVLYAATLSVISLCSSLIWEYAAFRHRLIPADLDEKTILSNRGSGWITTALFVLSIGVALLSPSLALLFWFAIFLIRPLLLRLLLKEEERMRHVLHGLAPAHVDAEKKPPTEHQP